MKRYLITAIVALLLSTVVSAQNQFEVLVERPGEKTFKGIISRDALTSDTSFKWYKEGLAGYSPDGGAMSALKKYRDSLQFIVFMGTWCEDSHFVIPKFYYLLDASGFPQDRVSLIGVDRSKKTLSHLTEAMEIINVPTIIVMKNGKEMGRVVEYGRSGLFDKDLGEIMNSTGAVSR
ncbi:MAG TPA: thioredoxin family protein [Chitinophagaceae bacterium]|nr:thioredoxin family protein [Chitinophagaceae bacterium]